MGGSSEVGDARQPAVPAGSGPKAQRDRLFQWLVAGTVLCYALGYPLALVGHSNVGWLFVFLGGVLLFAVLALVIRRLQH